MKDRISQQRERETKKQKVIILRRQKCGDRRHGGAMEVEKGIEGISGDGKKIILKLKHILILLEVNGT